MIQFVLPKGDYISSVGDGPKKEKLMTGKPASHPSRVGEQGEEWQRKGERANLQADSDVEWMGPSDQPDGKERVGERRASPRNPAGNPEEGLLQNLGLCP